MTPRFLARGLLLLLVLAGIFGMHVLTAEDGAGGHGALPMVGTAHHGSPRDAIMTPGEMSGHETSAAVFVGSSVTGMNTVLQPDPGSTMGHGDMAGCVLFLVVGAAALVLALLRLPRMIGSTGLVGFAGPALTDERRRGPPGRFRPRIALCVIRT